MDVTHNTVKFNIPTFEHQVQNVPREKLIFSRVSQKLYLLLILFRLAFLTTAFFGHKNETKAMDVFPLMM